MKKLIFKWKNLFIGLLIITYFLILPVLLESDLLPDSFGKYYFLSFFGFIICAYTYTVVETDEWKYGTDEDKFLIGESRFLKVLALSGVSIGITTFIGDIREDILPNDFNPVYLLTFSLLLLPLSYLPRLAISKINIKCPTCIGKGVLSREDIDKLKQEESSELIELVGNYLVIGTCRTCNGRGEVSPDASTLK